MRDRKVILEKISNLKKELKQIGFIIDGVIGSFTKTDYFNDIDLVYHLEDEFLNRYQGFSAINKIEEIREYLEKVLKIKFDLIDRDYSNKIMKEVIKRDLIHA